MSFELALNRRLLASFSLNNGLYIALSGSGWTAPTVTPATDLPAGWTATGYSNAAFFAEVSARWDARHAIPDLIGIQAVARSTKRSQFVPFSETPERRANAVLLGKYDGFSGREDSVGWRLEVTDARATNPSDSTPLNAIHILKFAHANFGADMRVTETWDVYAITMGTFGREITRTAFDALSDAEKNDGTTFLIDEDN